jgi:alkylation response protein AidB-like acyl-CoA dehydrogenase
MDLLPTEEQQQIIDTAASFLANEFPVNHTIANGKARISSAQLQQIAHLGWLGIGLPDDLQGVGYGLPEEALLFVELGRNLMPPSLLGSVLGARIAAQSDAGELLHAILQGQIKVALAVPRATRPVKIGASVSGDFLIFEPDNAQLILVADENGGALLQISSLQIGGSDRCIDPTLDLCALQLSAQTAACYVAADKDPIFLRGALLNSALLLGIAEATRDRSVSYAKEREQFGKPIGSFQSIKHYCAEMAVRCESIRAMLYHASITLHNASPAGTFDTCSLKALANAGAQANANIAVQIHGGMGYTQEMDIHLFVKRAQILGTLFGSERYHLQKMLHEPTPV